MNNFYIYIGMAVAAILVLFLVFKPEFSMNRTDTGDLHKFALTPVSNKKIHGYDLLVQPHTAASNKKIHSYGLLVPAAQRGEGIDPATGYQHDDPRAKYVHTHGR